MAPEQCRAGRLLLGWNQQRLGLQAGLSTSSARRFEDGLRCRPGTVTALCATLEEAGIEFTNGEGQGVRLRKGGALGEG